MADNLPVNFPIPGSSNLANYDFYDLATGTGYKDFYGADLITGAGTTSYILTTKTIYANTGYSQFYEAAGDRDFDLSLAVPLTIEGDCVFVLPCSSPSNVNVTVTIKFYKVDAGSVETQIGSDVSKAVVLNNSTGLFSGTLVLPNTRLKAGEKLRINVTTASPGGTKYFNIFHDPMNRTISALISTTITQFKISLPIKIMR